MQKKYIEEKSSRKNIILKRLGAIVVAIAIMLGGINLFSVARGGCFESTLNEAFADESDSSVVSAPTTLSDLKAMSVENIAGLSKFDARDFGLVTPVRDQGTSNLCWAYSTIAVSETSILYSGIDTTATKDNLRLSARNIGYSRFTRISDPLSNVDAVAETPSGGWEQASGLSKNAIDVLSEWCGVVLESAGDDVDGFTNAKYKLVEAVKITEANSSGDKSDETNTESVANNDARILAIKQAIAKYGAVTFSYYNANNYANYNPNNETGSGGTAHACAIIGWDDSIESSAFNPGGATQNGGWLVKNSYNDNEYFYLSYDVRSDNCYALRYEKADSLDYNYFYDRVTSTTTVATQMQNASKVANIFEAKGEKTGFGEYLKSVSVNTHSASSKAKISVYTGVTAGAPESGTKAYEEEFTFLYAGQNYVEFESVVQLTKGELYSVVVELSDSTGGSDAKYVEICSGVGQSYKYDGSGWSNMNNVAVAQVKAYTKMTELKDVKNATITLSSAVGFVYDGNEHRPEIRVSYGSGSSQVELVLGRDYTVEYANNVYAGNNAKVEISGIGEYYGTQSKTFTIQKAECPAIESSSIVQNSSGQLVITPSESARKLSDIALPEQWEWVNDQTLSYISQSFEARYTGSDVSSYKKTTINIFVKGIESLRPKDDEEDEIQSGPDSPTIKKEHKKSSTDPQNVIIILIVIFLAINIGIVVWINIVKNRRHIAMFEKKDAEREKTAEDLNGEVSPNVAPKMAPQNANTQQQFGVSQNTNTQQPQGVIQQQTQTNVVPPQQNIQYPNAVSPQQFGAAQNANMMQQSVNTQTKQGVTPQQVQPQAVSQPQQQAQVQPTQPQIVNQPQGGAVQQPQQPIQQQLQPQGAQPQQQAQVQPVQPQVVNQPQGGAGQQQNVQSQQVANQPQQNIQPQVQPQTQQVQPQSQQSVGQQPVQGVQNNIQNPTGV